MHRGVTQNRGRTWDEKNWPLHCLMNHDYERVTGREQEEITRDRRKETEPDHSNRLPHYQPPSFSADTASNMEENNVNSRLTQVRHSLACHFSK